MTTPFDTALRLQQRTVDTVRVAIGVELQRCAVLERDAATLAKTVARECAVRPGDARISSDAWLTRMRAERERLRKESHSADARLAALRLQAVEAYGAMRVIGDAADRHRAQTAQAIATSEQARLDDIAAVRAARPGGARWQ